MFFIKFLFRPQSKLFYAALVQTVAGDFFFQSKGNLRTNPNENVICACSVLNLSLAIQALC